MRSDANQAIVKEITEKAAAMLPLMRVYSTKSMGKVLKRAPTISLARVNSAKPWKNQQAATQNATENIGNDNANENLEYVGTQALPGFSQGMSIHGLHRIGDRTIHERHGINHHSTDQEKR